MNFHVVKDQEWFENMILLLQLKYNMVDLSFFEKTKEHKKSTRGCHITFDDGDQTFYNVAYPILKKHRVQSTLFVSPKIISERKNFWFQEVGDYDKAIMKRILSKELSLPEKEIEKISFKSILKTCTLKTINQVIETYQNETKTSPKPYQNMSLDEVLEVESSGLVTIGAHTLNHPILKNESDADSDYEISKSISDLEDLLGHQIQYFAYPNGKPILDFGEREINVLKKVNISIAVSMEIKHVSKNDNMFALPRIGISHGSMRFIKLKLRLGSFLERIKSLIRNTESKQRLELSALVSRNKVNIA